MYRGSNNNKRVCKDKWVMIMFTLPIVFLYSFFFLIPMLMGFYYSLTDWNGISENYKIIGYKKFKVSKCNLV